MVFFVFVLFFFLAQGGEYFTYIFIRCLVCKSEKTGFAFSICAQCISLSIIRNRNLC